MLGAILLGSAAISNAQVAGGKIILGGGMGFNSSSGETEIVSGGTTITTEAPKVTSLNFGPRIGYMITDDLGAGLIFNLTRLRTIEKNPNPNFKEINETISLNQFFLFGRYYRSLNEKFYLFGELAFGPGFGKTTIELTSINDVKTSLEATTSAFSVGLWPGISYFPHEKIGIELSVGLLGFNSMSVETTNPNNGDKSTERESNFNLGLNGGDQFSTGGINLSVLLYL